MTKQREEKVSWILSRIYENDKSKLNGDTLTTSEVVFYLEGWGEDCSDDLVEDVLREHVGN